jgi:hypothetical protein
MEVFSFPNFLDRDEILLVRPRRNSRETQLAIAASPIRLRNITEFFRIDYKSLPNSAEPKSTSDLNGQPPKIATIVICCMERAQSGKKRKKQ